MELTNQIHAIGAHDRQLAMRDLKPLSGLDRAVHDQFWPAWMAIMPRRRAEIARSMVELAEDNVDLDFSEALQWMLDDDDAEVRANAVEGLWENDSSYLLHRLLTLLRSDPAPAVRTRVAMSLSRFAYLAEIEELNERDIIAVRDGLLHALLDERQPLDVRRRALESAGYFGNVPEVQQQVGLAYESDEQLLRESALVAMGRSMLPRWMPTIAKELDSPSPALRYEAAHAVGEFADQGRTLLPKLMPLLNDSDSEVAFAAIWALGQVGGDSAKRLLQQIRKTDDEARRQAAIEALEELELGDQLI
jgi:HEAT repeat protein